MNSMGVIEDNGGCGHSRVIDVILGPSRGGALVGLAVLIELAVLDHLLLLKGLDEIGS